MTLNQIRIILRPFGEMMNNIRKLRLRQFISAIDRGARLPAVGQGSNSRSDLRSVRSRVHLTFFLAAFFVMSTSVFAADDNQDFIPLEELLHSPAANFFQTGDYQQALEEFKKISEQYPQDTLPRRYMGMCLILLGRLDEAVGILQEASREEPSNAALHYFLARAYHEQGASEKAGRELEEVLRLDPEGLYGIAAKDALQQVTRPAPVIPAVKPWDVTGTIGYEYDSNVRLAPNDTSLRRAGDESANRYSFSLGGKYRWLQKGDFTSRLGYRLYRSFHDDSLNEFNYTFQEFSLAGEYRAKIQNKIVRLGLREAIPLGFLSGNLFVFGNRLTAYLNSRLTKNTFTEVSHSYIHNEYGPDGVRPSLTSRDGEYFETGLLQRFYFSNSRRNIFFRYELGNVAARGNNFDRVGHSIETGFHTPLIKNILFDFSWSFGTGHYPHYSAEVAPAEPSARLNNDWALLTSLTFPLSDKWSLRTFYRYVNANNRNDIYQYDRHLMGTELRFRY